ncbi:MAG: DsrE family protein [Gammaproteobacteria bacterium]|nr:DsrE family protein [Gammaproteobacteria bacterium]MBL7000935.1 DsrE family protein [Gammaproteobacteria bacterium]
MHILIILNDPPYGTERSYNGLRLAKALASTETHISVFLLADAVNCAKAGQKVPLGFYNLELMLKLVMRSGEVLLCGTCMDARGISDDEVIDGVKRSTMQELAIKTMLADKLLVF